MAFQSSGLLWKCGKCHDRFTYYKLGESTRPHTVDHTENGEVCWRVCSGCEVALRRKEYANWPDETKAWHGADHPAPAAIKIFQEAAQKRAME